MDHIKDHTTTWDEASIVLQADLEAPPTVRDAPKIKPNEVQGTTKLQKRYCQWRTVSGGVGSSDGVGLRQMLDAFVLRAALSKCAGVMEASGKARVRPTGCPKCMFIKRGHNVSYLGTFPTSPSLLGVCCN